MADRTRELLLELSEAISAAEVADQIPRELLVAVDEHLLATYSTMVQVGTGSCWVYDHPEAARDEPDADPLSLSGYDPE